jgi:hypothetical protein
MHATQVIQHSITRQDSACRGARACAHLRKSPVRQRRGLEAPVPRHCVHERQPRRIGGGMWRCAGGWSARAHTAATAAARRALQARRTAAKRGARQPSRGARAHRCQPHRQLRRRRRWQQRRSGVARGTVGPRHAPLPRRRQVRLVITARPRRRAALRRPRAPRRVHIPSVEWKRRGTYYARQRAQQRRPFTPLLLRSSPSPLRARRRVRRRLRSGCSTTRPLLAPPPMHARLRLGAP